MADWLDVASRLKSPIRHTPTLRATIASRKPSVRPAIKPPWPVALIGALH